MASFSDHGGVLRGAMMVRCTTTSATRLETRGLRPGLGPRDTIRFRSYEQIQLARDIPEHPKIGYLGTLSYKTFGLWNL